MSRISSSLPTSARLWALLLLALALVLYACPPVTSGDDDPVQPDDDDDDDNDDDDTGGGDDDDFTIPEGLPIGGNLLWQVNDGEVPAAHVRVGLFPQGELGTDQADDLNTLVSEEGLTSGNTIFTIYIEKEPSADELSPLLASTASAATYVPIAYVDEDQDAGYDAGELLLGASMDLVVFIEEVAPFPSELSDLGAGPGWNLLNAESIDGAPMDFTHVPAGTNSSNGPSIRADLLPHMGGSIQVRTDVAVPAGGVMAAWYQDPLTGQASAAAEQFVTPASNEGAVGGALLSWTIGGEPPTDQIATLLPPVGPDPSSPGGADGPDLQGAQYQSVAYFDDGDLAFTEGGCDTLLGVGEGRPLVWLEPSTLNLEDAYFLQRIGQNLGWSLFDESLDAWRPLSVGIDLLAVAAGDDDDSAGDDDDSAGDDDDSAGDGPQIPPECFGDDDDSAGTGDDDDSAGPGPGGGPPPPVLGR